MYCQAAFRTWYSAFFLRSVTVQVSVLAAWEKQTDELLKEIEQKIDNATNHRVAAEAHKADYDKRVEDLKGQIKAVMETSMEGVDPEYMTGMMGMGGMMGMMGMGGMLGMGGMGGMGFDMGMAGRRGRDKGKGVGKGGKHMM